MNGNRRENDTSMGDPAGTLARLPTEAEGRRLLEAAFGALRQHFGFSTGATGESGATPLAASSLPPAAGLFATLECGEELRGCIGFLRDDVDLELLARRAVVAAAVDDPRFPPLGKEELDRVRISVTVLGPAVPLRELSEIRIGRDGLIVERSGARGLLLPQVAARRAWDAARFCSETCRKAGLPGDAWRREGTTVLRFEAVHFESGP